MSKVAPGSHWRLRALTGYTDVSLKNVGKFDEIVVDDWLHAEMMSHRHCVVHVGDLMLSVTIPAKGKAKVMIVEDNRACTEKQ